MARLEVEVVGNIDKLNKSLKKADKELKTFGKDASKSTAKASKGFNNLNKASGNAGATLTAFSRTVQDAPFGIMGVSNNITNLAEQFQFLQNKTGSAKGAFKELLSSLKGAGGITLAISLATSLLVIFGDQLFKTKNKAEELKKEQDKLNQSLDDYVDGLEAVSKANLKGTQNAQKELITLGQLKSVISDNTASLNSRLGAIDELRKAYPDYFKDLSDEDLLNGDLKTTYDELTKSILNRAKATAATNQIIKNSEKLLALESQLAAKSSEVAAEQEKVNKEVEAFKQQRLKINPTIDFNTGVFKQELENITNAYSVTLNNLKTELNNIEGEIQGIELSNINLEQGLAENITNSFKRAKTVVTKEVSNLNTLISNGVQSSGVVLQIPPIDTSLAQNSLQGLINKQNELNQNSLLVAQSVSGAFTTLGNNISSSLIQTQGIFGSFVGTIIQQSLKLVGQLVANSIKTAAVAKTTALTQITTSQAAAASKIASDAAMATSAVSSALVQIAAAKAVATGNAIVAGTQTAKASGPAAAFLLPVLIAGAVAAVGSAFKGIGGGGSTSTSGVAGGGSTSSGSVSSSTSSASFGDGGGTVVFEIAGTSLIGVLNRTLQQNGNLGGAISIST